jgi:ketosteroid isomerase-like protein
MGDAPMSDERKIRHLLQSRAVGISQRDVQKALAPMAPDVVLYDLPPPLEFRGEDARDAENLQGWFDTWEGEISSKLSEPTIFVSGDLAVAHGFVHLSGVKKKEGPLDNWFRSTVVLKKTNDGWRIVHEHNSFPMKMDGSGRAATDEKP